MAKVREATAYGRFKRMRWPQTDGEPFCPKCGTLSWCSMSRGRLKCSDKACKAVFTVTSGTVFASRTLSFKKMVMAIWLSVNSVKGKAALQLSREIGVQFKTAWVMLMKLREAIAWQRRHGAQGRSRDRRQYAGGHIRPENKAEDRVDRRPRPRSLSAKAHSRFMFWNCFRRGGQTFTRGIRDEDGGGQRSVTTSPAKLP
ncbi:transposase [Mesorhizobium helmanticense]|uniref:Transposase zinc-ribbon domain-containing protein n=1 Tax=Mesorhizobium helmanticense TaxID=1776423 RepID=A0A2T4IKZ8_9HYPH|nr:transposase [Mesorhizobium helmanticense]PTE06314.1 hypothetical protein C9427_32495 [Mesorhizobium helmanticense]